MTTEQFFDYLHEHPATKTLAEALARICADRRRRRLVPSPVRMPVDRDRVTRSA